MNIIQSYYLSVLFLFFGLISYSQVKIGNNINTIDNTSILELESTSKVFVLTRLTNTQMNALNPLPGGMVFNKDTNCIHSYNGATWVKLCDSESGSFSFVNNNNGTFTINYTDGTSFTSSNLTGPQGIKGESGAQGIQGEKGDAGETGLQGLAGTQGMQGEKGDAGDTGEQGQKGDAGETGLQGLAGTQGIQGEKGDTGETGLQGIQGEKGDAATDNQQISTDNSPGQLSITGGTSLTLNINDADNSVNNEIQTLSVLGNNLTISGSGGNTIALPSFLGTEGSIFYADSDGTITENNGQLYWDASNSGLGINTNNPKSSLDISGSLATAITKTTNNLALDENHHTIVIGGNHNLTLPAASTSLGRMYIIKNATNNQITISSYQDQTGTATTTIPEETIIWLQSDGADWQLINNITGSNSTGGDTGGSEGTEGAGPTGTQTTNLVSYYMDDGQNGTANNFQLQVTNESNNPISGYEVLIENAPYATIPGLVLGEYTHEVIDNGDGTYNHIFTNTATINAYENKHIVGGPNISPPGTGLGCGCVSFFEL